MGACLCVQGNDVADMTRVPKMSKRLLSAEQHTPNEKPTNGKHLDASISPQTVDTVEDVEESPSSSTLFSPYLSYNYQHSFLSPLSTVIVEEEDTDMPSDEEDSVYKTPIQTKESNLSTVQSRIVQSQIVTTPLAELDPSTQDAVNPDCLDRFQSLKLTKLLQRKSAEKQRKQNKIEQRMQEVQSNSQLWESFQEIKDEVSSMNSEPHIDDVSLTELNEMCFDFSSVDFDEDASQCSGNLSLLSHEGLESQRQYFEGKKKQRKRAKKQSKRSTSSGGGGSVSSFGSKDYGPSRPTVNLRDMEVFLPEIESSLANIESDAASCVSDLGDESALGSNAPLSKYDYAVRRKRRGVTPNNDKSLRTKLDFLENTVASLRCLQNPDCHDDDAKQVAVDHSAVAEASFLFDYESSCVTPAPSRSTIDLQVLHETSHTIGEDSTVASEFGELRTAKPVSQSLLDRQPLMGFGPMIAGAVCSKNKDSGQADGAQLKLHTEIWSDAVHGEANDYRHPHNILSETLPDAVKMEDEKCRHRSDMPRNLPTQEPQILDAEDRNHDQTNEIWEAASTGANGVSGSVSMGTRPESVRVEDDEPDGAIEIVEAPVCLAESVQESHPMVSSGWYEADSQAKRLLQKTRSYVHTLSTDDFRRMSFGDPLSCLSSYSNVDLQPPSDEDSFEVPEGEEVATPNAVGGGREGGKCTTGKSAATQTQRSILSLSDSDNSIPLQLPLAGEVEHQMTAVLTKLKQSNEKT